MRVSLVLALLLALSPLAVSASNAQTQQKGAAPSKAPAFSHQTEREKVNENLLMLLGGTLGGPWIQMAQDVAITVSDGDNLRVLPLAGGGAKSNLRDILLARGVDLGITRLDVLNDAKASGELGPHLERRVAYITPLAVDMLQVLARPEVSSLKDLAGKKVNVYPKGSVASNVFKMLGIEIQELNLALPDSVQQMRTGEVDASACICSVPIPVFAAVSADMDFKLLNVPYVAALEESFLPASLSSDHFPNQIAKDSKVQTVGTQLLLVTYNWAPGTDRYRRIEKFVGALFSKFDKMRQPPRHPSWRQVNLSASVRGWQRFLAAKQWLDRQAAQAAKAKPAASDLDATQARAQAAKTAPHDAAAQERLFKEFLEWSRQRPKR
jgi:TRAP-type uncharacterized transport system substrate-binding protein